MNAEAQPVNVSMAAKQYVAAGLVLVAFDRGTKGKGPQHKGWNKRENCITTAEQASNLYGNIGVALLYSRLVSIDIDNMPLAVSWFGGVGIDLQGYWDDSNAVRMTSGRPDRGKIFYRMPDHIAVLVTRMFKGDGVELRCGTAGNLTVQDVLPPSIHPVTGEAYRWLGQWRDIPEMPADLLSFWLALSAPRTVGLNGAATPAGVGREDIEEALARIKAEALDYDKWLHVGMALHHETSGDEVGLEMWDTWSQTGGEKYKKGFAELETKWRGFRLDHENPITLRSLAYLAGPVDMTPEYEPVAADALAVETAKALLPRFKIETSTEFVEYEYEDDYIERVLPDDGYTVLMGQSGDGKTFTALDMILAMARSNCRWRDRDTKPARVLYIAAEGSVGVRKRLKAYAQHHGVALADLNVEWLGDCPDLTQDADVNALIPAIKARGSFTHIVIDTWSQVTAGADENSSRDMGAALKRVKKLRRATGSNMMFVAHVGKDPTKGLRGWSGFKAAMDCQIEVSRDGDKRMMTVRKLRDEEDGETFAFHLLRVQIGVTKRGKPVTSCVVIHDANLAAPTKAPIRVGKVETQVLDVIEDAFAKNAGEAPTREFAVQLAFEKYPPKKNEKTQTIKNLRRAIKNLLKKRLLEEKDGKLWPFSPDMTDVGHGVNKVQ
jgi:hypothetical protein